MTNVTFAVPEELHKVMKNHPEIKWSEIARHAMKEYATRLEILDKITSKSRFSEKDVSTIDEMIKTDLAKKYEKIMKQRHAR